MPRYREVCRGLQTALSKAIGPVSAHSELQWMHEAAVKSGGHSSPTSVVEAMVHRRIKGEPLQYILGSQPFGSLDIITRPPTLIPRPETEHWVLRLAKLLRPNSITPISMIDLCTGTGCIPLLLSHLWPAGSVHAVGIDRSADAVSLARENATKSGMHGNTLKFIQADVFDPAFSQSLPNLDPFPTLLTCNPPYISASSYKSLPTSVSSYEDPLALLGAHPDHPADDHDGLSFYRRISELLPHLVGPGAFVVLEFGEGQGDAVIKIMCSQRVRKVEVWRDQFGVDRVFTGWT